MKDNSLNIRLIIILLVVHVVNCVYAETPGLLAHYPLDGDFNDISGNKYHLTPISPNQTFSNDRQLKKGANKCLGPTNGKGKCGAFSVALPSDISHGMTICGFMLKDKGNNYHGKIFGFGNATWNEPGLGLEIAGGFLIAGVTDKKYQRYKRFNDGFWHHLALVVPSPDDGGEYVFYLDGKKVLSGPVKILPAYGKFEIAKFAGKQSDRIMVDEVKVFKKALNSAEVAEEAEKHGDVRTKPLKLEVDKRHRRIVPKESILPKGRLKIHFITNEWICVIGDYNDFIRKRIHEECGVFLSNIEKNRKSIKEWERNFHYNYSFDDVIIDYRPKIKANFENKEYFRIERGGHKIAVDDIGYWINAIGQMRMPAEISGKTQYLRGAEVAHFAYLKLAVPMQNGKKYVLTTKNGEKISFLYNERKCVSWAIKINQVGYMPDAGRKYAYLGLWLGGYGYLDLAKFAGKEFQIIDSKTGKTEFAGKIALRMKDSLIEGSPVNGEDVYQMDFSNFSKLGKYFIYVPGVGRSWDFRISPDTIGEAFYIHTRGLYHQRCGIAKEKPYTNWLMGKCHPCTWQAGFEPNERRYKARKDKYGYRDENDKPITLKHFNVVAETATEKKLPNVYGGWHDAADYDRRELHFSVVNDLLAAYIMFPEKFKDGQLNIPESGNGIPDIVDEAAWGMDVWRKAQQKNGGCGTWIEATSHPKNPNPATDTQRYYLSLPTIEGTMKYAAHAALLANAYKHCGRNDLSKKYLESAEQAFHYASDPANAVTYSWHHPLKKQHKKQTSKQEYVTYTYKEPPEINKQMMFKAAFNLWRLTKNQRYKDAMKAAEKTFFDDIGQMHWKITPFDFIEVILDEKEFPEYAAVGKKRILQLAEERLKWQEMQAYRNLNWPPSHGYFKHLAWGNSVTLRKARIFVAAYRLSGDKRFRDAALLLNDWQSGANPMGRTMTTGLGTVYPARLLHLASESDGIVDPVPGITIYGFTYGISFMGRQLVQGLYLKERRDFGFFGAEICLLPRTWTECRNLPFDKTKKIIGKKYPIWRRFCNLQGLEVKQNEFSVWETISPCAAVTACLLPDDWMPSEELKQRIPKDSLEDIEGYLFQP